MQPPCPPPPPPPKRQCCSSGSSNTVGVTVPAAAPAHLPSGNLCATASRALVQRRLAFLQPRELQGHHCWRVHSVSSSSSAPPFHSVEIKVKARPRPRAADSKAALSAQSKVETVAVPKCDTMENAKKRFACLPEPEPEDDNDDLTSSSSTSDSESQSGSGSRSSEGGDKDLDAAFSESQHPAQQPVPLHHLLAWPKAWVLNKAARLP